MGLLFSFIGRLYFWFKEGRNESFLEGVILKKSSQDEISRNYYTGLKLFLFIGAIVTILYIFYLKITNQEIS